MLDMEMDSISQIFYLGQALMLVYLVLLLVCHSKGIDLRDLLLLIRGV